ATSAVPRPTATNSKAATDRPVFEDVFGGAIPAGCFRAAQAAIRSGVTEQREGVGQAHRIVGCDAIELERVLPADRQCAELFVAETAIDLGVERLAAATAVRIRGLLVIGDAGVLNEGTAAVGEFSGQGIDTCIRPADGIPAKHDRYIELHTNS